MTIVFTSKQKNSFHVSTALSLSLISASAIWYASNSFGQSGVYDLVSPHAAAWSKALHESLQKSVELPRQEVDFSGFIGSGQVLPVMGKFDLQTIEEDIALQLNPVSYTDPPDQTEFHSSDTLNFTVGFDLKVVTSGVMLRYPEAQTIPRRPFIYQSWSVFPPIEASDGLTTDIGHIDTGFIRLTTRPPKDTTSSTPLIAEVSLPLAEKKQSTSRFEDDFAAIEALVALAAPQEEKKLMSDNGDVADITDMHFSALTINADEFRPAFVERVGVIEDANKSIPAESLGLQSLTGMDAEQMRLAIVLIAAQQDPSVAVDFLNGSGTTHQIEKNRPSGIPPISRANSDSLPEDVTRLVVQNDIARVQNPTLSGPKSLSPWRVYQAPNGDVMVSQTGAHSGGVVVRTGMILGDLGKVEGVTKSADVISIHTSSGETLTSANSTAAYAEQRDDRSLLEILEERE